MEKVKYTVEKAEYHNDMFYGWKPARLRDVLVEEAAQFFITKWVSLFGSPYYPERERVTICLLDKTYRPNKCEKFYQIHSCGVYIFTEMDIPEEWIEKLL